MLTEPPPYARLIGPAAIDPIRMRLPLAGVHAKLGFPSPAEDFLDDDLDLNELLIRNPAATFHYRADGLSMIMAGICDGDILIVDRSESPADGDVVIACWDGNQPSCKVLKIAADHIELHTRNPHFPNIVLPPGTDVEVFAVIGVVRQLRRNRSHVRAR